MFGILKASLPLAAVFAMKMKPGHEKSVEHRTPSHRPDEVVVMGSQHTNGTIVEITNQKIDTDDMKWSDDENLFAEFCHRYEECGRLLGVVGCAKKKGSGTGMFGCKNWKKRYFALFRDGVSEKITLAYFEKKGEDFKYKDKRHIFHRARREKRETNLKTSDFSYRCFSFSGHPDVFLVPYLKYCDKTKKVSTNPNNSMGFVRAERWINGVSIPE